MSLFIMQAYPPVPVRNLKSQNVYIADRHAFQAFQHLTKGAQDNSTKQLCLNFLPINPLPYLSTVRFSVLQLLDISFNKVVNIEFLINLQASFLSYLKLNGNFIVCFRHLRKCSFPSLRRIRMEDNYPNELQLYECNFPKLSEICIGQGLCSFDDLAKVQPQLVYVKFRLKMKRGRYVRMVMNRHNYCLQEQECSSSEASLTVDHQQYPQ